MKCCIWSVALCDAATGTVDRKYFGSFVPILVLCNVTVLCVYRTNICTCNIHNNTVLCLLLHVSAEQAIFRQSIHQYTKLAIFSPYTNKPNRPFSVYTAIRQTGDIQAVYAPTHQNGHIETVCTPIHQNDHIQTFYTPIHETGDIQAVCTPILLKGHIQAVYKPVLQTSHIQTVYTPKHQCH